MDKTSVKERRVHERHATTVTLQGTPDEGGVVARMVASNVSMGGLYCTSSTDFAEMTRLAVRLMLPMNGSPDSETAPVDMEAVVVRRQEVSSRGRQRFQLALFFTNIDDLARQRLKQYLEKHRSA